MVLGLIPPAILLLVLYIYLNDRRLKKAPSSILQFGPKRCTPEDVRAMEISATFLDDKDVLPAKTGRRYIVVGGGGFLGGWIVEKLLKRGEEFHHIRLLDLSPSSHPVVVDAVDRGVQFIKVDITDSAALEAAFTAPWPKLEGATGGNDPDITVFHTAANIRFYERHPEFLNRSSRVNFSGTQNVINATRLAGARVLIYTSSGSVGVHGTRLFLWPWETEAEKFVQVINDDEARIPKEAFSNYATVKLRAERLVCAADKTPTGSAFKPITNNVLRTGCIRPGNSIIGPQGDLVIRGYVKRKNNPVWIKNVIQSFCYVENCAASHLCYEARLIELQEGTTTNPDIGGQSFCITDPGPTPSYGDVYTTIATLTNGVVHFPSISLTFMLLFAYAIEWYYRTQFALVKAGWWFAKWLPPITGDIVNLQPSMFHLTSVHLVFDDSRARLPPAKGGLGYSGGWTTLEGVHRTVMEEYKDHKEESKGSTLGLPVPDKLKVVDAIPLVAPVDISNSQ